jgi:UDP-N-acetylmuramyl tripeptide synthase
MYRDQLDAYGELDKTAEYIKNACQNSPDALLILNSDDPIITTLSAGLPHKKVTYSLGGYAKQFQYEGSFSASAVLLQTQDDKHRPDIVAKSIAVNDDLSTETQIESRGKMISIHFTPPGMYNVYNALAAYTASQELGVKEESVISALATVQPPFGRGEIVTFQKDGKTVTFQIFLVKNPAGYSQVWDMLRQIKTPFNLILGLNDNIADGRDVSWIWDIELTPFSRPDTLQLISFTGKRAYDMALRLKYAEIGATSQSTIPDIPTSLENMIQKSTDGRHTFVLMTYTAMNRFRSALGNYVTLSPYTS